jgi:hypothetical protein
MRDERTRQTGYPAMRQSPRHDAGDFAGHRPAWTTVFRPGGSSARGLAARWRLAMTRPWSLMACAALAGWVALAAPGLVLAAGSSITCKMTYSLRGWSAFYKTASGSGAITCSNGQKAQVKIRAKGGGITFGKSEIVHGSGEFAGARDISELFGSYAQSEVHAGAGKSADAQAMTKGLVSLVLAGKGRGVDLGFAFGTFTIQRAK